MGIDLVNTWRTVCRCRWLAVGKGEDGAGSRRENGVFSSPLTRLPVMLTHRETTHLSLGFHFLSELTAFPLRNQEIAQSKEAVGQNKCAINSLISSNAI